MSLSLSTISAESVKKIIDDEIALVSEKMLKQISDIMNKREEKNDPILVKTDLLEKFDNPFDKYSKNDYLDIKNKQEEKIDLYIFPKTVLSNKALSKYSFLLKKINNMFDKYSKNDCLDIKNIRNIEEINILIKISCVVGDLPICKYLVNKGTNKYIRSSALNCAIKGNFIQIVKFLVETGITDKDKNYALRLSARSGFIDIVKYLVETGVNKKGKIDALEIAVIKGFTKIVKYLVENDTDIESCSALETSLSVAKKNMNIIKYLVEKHVQLNIDIPDKLIDGKETDINKFLFMHVKESQRHLFHQNIVKSCTFIKK